MKPLSTLTQEALNAKGREIEMKQAIIRRMNAFSSADILCVTDASGRVVDITERLVSLLGVPKEEVLDRNLFEIMHQDDRKEATDFTEIIGRIQTKMNEYLRVKWVVPKSNGTINAIVRLL